MLTEREEILLILHELTVTGVSELFKEVLETNELPKTVMVTFPSKNDIKTGEDIIFEMFTPTKKLTTRTRKKK